MGHPELNPPYRLGRRLAPEAWREVRMQAIFDCCKWNIQSEDHCILADYPLILDRREWLRLQSMAEELAAEAVAAEMEMLSLPRLHSVIGITSRIRRVLSRAEGASPAAARVMRFDLHLTEEGWRISEVNADVPGGYIEASGFNQLMATHYPEASAPPDVAAACVKAILECCGTGVVGMVHATAYTDDREVMQYLAQRLAAAGVQPVMASPEHVHWEGGHATLRTGTGATPLAAMVRFFPAEWLPIMGSSKRWARYFCDGQTPISNPGTAILLQSKRFPLAWPHLRTGLAAFRRLMPPACDPREVKRSERDVYVLKPVFGRVGEDIFMAGITPAEAWEKAWRVARRRPLEWVAQRRFGALPISDGGGKLYPTIGVYTVDGCAAGAYARIAGRPLVDHEAQDVAMLIENEVRR